MKGDERVSRSGDGMQRIDISKEVHARLTMAFQAELLLGV